MQDAANEILWKDAMGSARGDKIRDNPKVGQSATQPGGAQQSHSHRRTLSRSYK